MQPKKYPVGIQTFEIIRREGYLYVDKTDYIWNLVHGGGKAFFLNRPRRFGKSLLLSTMQAYFEGRRDLFEGLAIDGLETEWEPGPVIRLDMSLVKQVDVDGLMASLDRILRSQEERFGGNPADVTPGSRLQTLIQRAAGGERGSVVILVDEYDAPLLNVVDDPEMLERFRQVMREFYIPLKACDADLRFVFLTGITKFSQLLVFSELNNLVNISMNPAYAGICGISEEELHSQMEPDVQALSDALGIGLDETYARLKTFYDGYHFCEPSPDLYNPFSLLSSFFNRSIDSYWFGTGTPTSLIKMISSHGWQITDLESCDALDSDFDQPTESMDSPLPMLYQAGYLTIKAYDRESTVYTLGIPNQEVSRGLSESLVRHVAKGALTSHNAFLIKFARDFRNGDIDEALARLRAYLAGIPYHLGSRDERGFQTKFYLIFDLLGIQIATEFKTATGRVDAVVRSRGTTYVMEFKYGKTAAEALAQIYSKDYALPFSAGDGRVIKVGVSFSPDEQTIDDWIIRSE